MSKLSKAEFSRRLSAAEVHLSESEDDSDTSYWVDEDDNAIPRSPHFRGMNLKLAQKILNDAVAKYISEYRNLQDFMVQVEAMQCVHSDTTPEQEEKIFGEVRARRKAEGRVLSERELKLLASKEMNKYGSYEAYQNRPREPLPDHIRKKIDEVYGPSKTDTDGLITEKVPRSAPKQKCLLDGYEDKKTEQEH